MKKIGKKISYFIKVFLVTSLLFNNLSSLSVVFADELDPDTEPEVVVSGEITPETETVSDEVSPDPETEAGVSDGNPEEPSFDANIDDDSNITVNYTGELESINGLYLYVVETFTYTHCEDTEEKTCTKVSDTQPDYEINDESKELLTGEGVTIAYPASLLDEVKLDGTYELLVILRGYNENEEEIELGRKVLKTQDVTGEEGIEFKLFDPNGNEIQKTDGKYVVSPEYATVEVVGTILPGGIGPYDVFTFDGDENSYTGEEVLSKEIKDLIGFSNRLYGEFTLPYDVIYTKNGDEATYQENFKISYGTYPKNAEVLNANIDTNKVVFESETAKGHMYVYLGESNLTIADIYTALKTTYADREITYTISNADYSAENGGIVDTYAETEGESLEDYLETFAIDSSTVITLTDGTITITYETVVIGDINGDNKLDKDDLIAIIDQIVGNEELNKDKSDIHSDDEVNVLDVMELDQIIKTGSWQNELAEEEIELGARIELANENQIITSGDEFEVNYVLTPGDHEIGGIAGTIEYDKSILELVSITPKEGFVGSDKDGKFIYVTEEYTGKSNVEAIYNTETDEEEVFLVIKFKAIAGGTSTITIKDPEYFNQDTYYKIVEIDEETGESKPTTNVITLDVEVAVSSDNSLSSLKIGDNEIELVDGIYDYTLTVPNDVTTIDVNAITSNTAANITSIISPEELAEGDNTITIIVTAEDGTEQEYTIVVTREEAPKEEQETVASGPTYQGTTTKPTTKPEEKPQEEPVEPEPVKENKASKIIIIGLTILAILALIYLIFKDDDDESKKANKDISKMKKENFDAKEPNNSKPNNKYNQNKNNKKGR